MAKPHWSQFSTEFFTRTRDDWLTDVLGVESWNVSSGTQTEAPAAPNLTEPLAGPAFLTAKVPAGDIHTVKRLSELGFYLVDTALTFQFESREMPESVHRSWPDRLNWIVTDATPEDADPLGQIASRAFTSSRFHLDPGISSEAASAIKSEWSRSLALGRRGIRCRVVRGASGVEGFLGVVESRGNQRILTIDLIAVDPDSQGHGVGAALVRDFLVLAQAEGALAQVGTQAANTSAARFYEGLGFALTSVTHVMHAHVPTEDPS